MFIRDFFKFAICKFRNNSQSTDSSNTIFYFMRFLLSFKGLASVKILLKKKI